MSLTLRYMQPGDIPEVLEIERVSFNPAWSARSYAYEVSESTYSHMVVLERQDDIPPASRWQRWLAAVAGPADKQSQVIAYGGLWFIAGEGHISTIASHPHMRGQGFGEAVLAAMIHRCLTLDADYLILEVRVSNTVAQNLYRKYGFVVTGVKTNYYQSNNEDAYEMRLQIAGVENYPNQFATGYDALLRRLGIQDAYSMAEPPFAQR
jgi:ribosomal-protein-alanine N-acetyltransferase